MLRVRELAADDATTLSAMLREQPTGYLQYFRPFAFDEATVSDILRSNVADIYLGLFWYHDLAAFCMLRGWDEGYDVPAYGVVVASRYQGNGLGALTLELARTICRLRGSPRLMLKVHPDNAAARRLYQRAGLKEHGRDDRSGDIIMYLEI